jgi:transposase
VIAWLSERSAPFREGIEYVAIDPAAAYASAVRTPGLLPNATLVVDHFHPIDWTNSGSGVCRAGRNLVEGVGSL